MLPPYSQIEAYKKETMHFTIYLLLGTQTHVYVNDIIVPMKKKKTKHTNEQGHNYLHTGQHVCWALMCSEREDTRLKRTEEQQ